MKALKTLLKEYDLTQDTEYFEIIIESVINGQFMQSTDQFLSMKQIDRKRFVKYAFRSLSDGSGGLDSNRIEWFIDNI